MPWLATSGFMGQDTNGSIDTTTITYDDSLRVQIAEIGRAWYLFSRCFTQTFQYELGQIKEINPDFEYFIYGQWAHVTVYEPGDGVRPLETARKDLLWPYRVRDTADSVIAAFRINGEITAYWANYGMGTGYDLIDEEIELYVTAWNEAEHKPFGMMIDYFNGSSISYSGYYEFDDGQRHLLDLDDDGVAFDNDTNEQAVYETFQEYWVQRLRERFNDKMVIIGNGKGSLNGVNNSELGDMVSLLDGYLLEGYPGDCPFLNGNYNDTSDVYDIGYDGFYNSAYANNLSRNGPWWLTDLKPIYELDNIRAKYSRAGALLFDGVWSHRPYDNDGTINAEDIIDEAWDSWVDTLGEPLAGPYTTTDGADKSWSRLFEGGLFTVTLDTTQTGAAQLSTGSVTIDGVAQ